MAWGSFDLYLNMLFTYQGMGNLITITEQGKPHSILWNALIDFGSTAQNECDATVEWMYQYLTGGGAYDGLLDFVSISHRDNDHWSMFPPLLDKMKAGKCKLRINRLAYGDQPGNYEKTGPDNLSVIERLRSCLVDAKEEVHYAVGEQSAYLKTSALAPLRSYNAAGKAPEIHIMPVAVNVISSSKRKDIQVNTVSLVVAVVYNGLVMLLPGDATAETIGYINVLFEDHNGSQLANARMLSVPHHGALRTIASNYTTKKPKLDIAKEFAASVAPITIGASAGFLTHHHPNIEVLNLFEKSVGTTTWALHDYVAYKDSLYRWQAHSTTRGIYTTYLAPGTDGRRLNAKPARIVYRIRGDDGWLSVLIKEPPGTGGVWAVPERGR